MNTRWRLWTWAVVAVLVVTLPQWVLRELDPGIPPPARGLDRWLALGIEALSADWTRRLGLTVAAALGLGGWLSGPGEGTLVEAVWKRRRSSGP
jgi:hypothetical protein